MIERITVVPAVLPMRFPFAHAAQRRTATSSVLVVVAAAGHEGWGEGAPRPYVTGENLDTAVDALRRVTPRMLDDLIDLTGFADAVRVLARLDLPGTVGGQAAAAALETALFDLACRIHGRHGFDALRCLPEVTPLLRSVPSPVPVSFVLDLSRPVTELPFVAAGTVRHVKIKATADIDRCARRVADVRERLGDDASISVDANGAWDAVTAVRAAARMRELGVAWIEEPTPARDWALMREIRRATGASVMLDESCAGPDDLDAALEHDAADHINARVSKAGGVFPTLRLLAAAHARDVGVQLGVHVGEVGPLWAAGRLLACAVEPLVAVEAGRSDEWFATPLTEQPFGVDRTTYVAEPLPGPGTGVTPSAYLRSVLREKPRTGSEGGTP